MDKIKNRQLYKDTGLNVLTVSEHIFSQSTLRSTAMSAHSHSSLENKSVICEARTS